MPGVHVRTAGQFDWVQQSKELVLTVPGSYWLFHKKNIYKFIFRYHRTIRNMSKFAYGKELMKVIRKIIKCHPRHGQQFATQNLLVAYSHTSWTRQDKMFAMLKFQNRNDAAAYSHAFVLTIKVSEKTKSKVESPVSTLHPSTTQCKDTNDEIFKTGNEKEPTEFFNQSLEKSTTKTNTCSTRVRVSSVECKNRELHNDSTHDNSGETGTKREKRITRTPNNVNIYNTDNDSNVSENVQSKSGAMSTRKSGERKSSFRDSVTLNKSDGRHKINRKLVFVDEKKDNAKNGNTTITDSKHSHSVTPSTHAQEIPLKESSKRNSKSRQHVHEPSWLNELKPDKNSHCHKKTTVQNDTNTLNDRANTNCDGTVDSVNLPYQYLIEKEIEDARNKIPPACSSDTKNSHVSSSETIPRQTNGNARSCKRTLADDVEEHSTGSPNPKKFKPDEKSKEIPTDCAEHDGMKSRDLSATKLNKTDRRKAIEKKVVFDGKASRSSDITDLVMEGLMFTIRQDKDSVAVIEQKTKLEVDEVLENSEKAETKEGEKCLRNSSLLGLENLITMLDQPEHPERKNKINNILHHDNTLQLKSYSNTFSSKKASNASTGDSINHTRQTNLSSEDGEKPKQNENSCTSQWSVSRNGSCTPTTSCTNNSNSFLSNNGNSASNGMHLRTSDNREPTNSTENTKEADEEEEDIIPEILQKKIHRFKSNKSTSELSSRSTNRDLLMDDLELEQTLKLKKKRETPVKKFPLLNTSNDFHPENSSENNSIRSDKDEVQKRGINVAHKSSKYSDKHENNIPRIVSNQVITVDQMPLALQKALRSKLGKLKVTPNAKVLENRAKTSEEQTTDKKDSETPDVKLKTQITQCDSAKNAKYCLDSDPTVNNDNNICSDAAPSTISNNQSDSNDMSDNTQKAEEKESQVKQHGLSKPSKVGTNELQDITQEFYSDLMNLQKKHNCDEQRCRNQRRRSPKSHSDTKNDEIRVEMLKFIQDITRGAKVVVTRMSTKNISSIVGKNSSLTTCLN